MLLQFNGNQNRRSALVAQSICYVKNFISLIQPTMEKRKAILTRILEPKNVKENKKKRMYLYSYNKSRELQTGKNDECAFPTYYLPELNVKCVQSSCPCLSAYISQILNQF